MEKAAFLLLLVAVSAVHGHQDQLPRSEQLSLPCDQVYREDRQGKPLASINHPANYLNSHTCSFDIIAPPRHSIYVIFDRFHLEQQTTCNYDYLQIFNGDERSSSLAKLCGNDLPDPIKSTGSRLHIKFKTDSSITFAGFQLRYYFCENRHCCHVKTVASSGSISSPNYPRLYPSNRHCTYHLRADKPWKRIALSFETFRLESHARCEFDNVTVRLGFDPASCTSKGYCGVSPPPPAVSPNSQLTVTFRSDQGIHHPGFRAAYRLVDEGASGNMDMCWLNNGCCKDVCRTENGHVHCSCHPGKILNPDGRTCRYPSYCELPLWQRRALFSPGTRVVPGEHYGSRMGPRGRVGVVRHVGPTSAFVCWLSGGDCVSYGLCSPEMFLSLENPATTVGMLHDLPCGANNGGCDHECRVVDGRPVCSCFAGFTSPPGNRSVCIVDGCTDNNGGCAQGCRALSGSRVLCTCPAGWTVRPDGGCNDVDECASKNGGCEQRCVNTEGSHRCECNTISFRIADNGRNCTDVNECLNERIHHCAHRCVNTFGSFFCQCHSGFTVSPNGRDCVDIDECSNGPGIRCQHKCVNTPGFYHCDCHQGYRVNPDHNHTCLDVEECRVMADFIRDKANCLGCSERSPFYECTACKDGYALATNKTWCNDKNECLEENGGCQHFCVNTPGGHRCTCMSGFQQMDIRQGMSRRNICVNIDECARNGGGCSHTCTDMPGSFRCSCPSGSELGADNKTCEDNNECSRANGGCRQICTNFFGGHNCSCRSGFFLADDDKDCVDVNECSAEDGGCRGETSSCENTVGSYRCKCGAGYKLAEDGHTCEDINECSPELNNCDHNCQNVPGTYICSCNRGYELNVTDGHTCHDINECVDNPCDSTCYNRPGSYFCSCLIGFRLQMDNHTCEDINECSEGTSGCQHNCFNNPGSFRCGCRIGYNLSRDDGKSCNDINECATPEQNCCNQHCRNTDGSYRCGCNDGFYLDADRCTCKDVLECANQNGGCEQVCVEERGSYRCECLTGFTQDRFNRTQCHDINECNENNGGCDQNCVNLDGSYECRCGPLFKLKADGHTCTHCPSCETFTDLVILVQQLALEVSSLRAEVAVLKGNSNHTRPDAPRTEMPGQTSPTGAQTTEPPPSPSQSPPVPGEGSGSDLFSDDSTLETIDPEPIFRRNFGPA